MATPKRLAEALKALEDERKDLAEKLAKVDKAIAALEPLVSERFVQRHGFFPVKAKLPEATYSGMKLADAAELELRRAGRGLSTRDLWEGIAARGAESDSKNPANSLYTVLKRASERFTRTNGKWFLLNPGPGSQGGDIDF